MKENYIGFIPSQISITDEKGTSHSVQTISFTEGRWVRERNVSIHGTFSSKAVRNFDEHNLEAEKYNVKGSFAYPPKTLIDKEKAPTGNKRKPERRQKNSIFQSTRNKAIIIFYNSDGGRNLGGRLKSIIIGSTDKGKSLMVYEDQHTHSLNPYHKRKVSFPSPKNKTFFYNPDSAPAKPISIHKVQIQTKLSH